MLEPGRNLDLAEKPLRAQRGGQLRMEQLEGHPPVVLEILGQEDRRHAAAADLALDRVAAGEGGVKPMKKLGHRSAIERLGGWGVGGAEYSAEESWETYDSGEGRAREGRPYADLTAH